MELIAIPILLMMLVFVGIGVGLGVFMCGLAAVLVMGGVISSSAALGLITRRPAVALRVFLLQCGVLAGIPAGAVAAWLGHELLERFMASQALVSSGGTWQIPALGALGGAVGGAALALLMDFVFRRSHAWLAGRTTDQSPR